jgi:hypothetical protein
VGERNSGDQRVLGGLERGGCYRGPLQDLGVALQQLGERIDDLAD